MSPLKTLREARGLSQSDMAELTGTSQQQISRWEGQDDPKVSTVVVYALKLKANGREVIEMVGLSGVIG